jgi:sugar lactone lactonase YvrE
MSSPNGSAVTPDGRTLIVAETAIEQLTAFTIADDGSLSDRRVYASVPGWHPDGVCLDTEGAVWFGSPMTQEFVRVYPGGAIAARVSTPGRWAVTCALGGPDRCTFYGVTGRNSVENIMRLIDDRSLDPTSDAEGWIETMRVDVPGAGWP